MEKINKKFQNSRLGLELDVYVHDGKEWFLAKDISDYLGYEATAQATRHLNRPEIHSCVSTWHTAQGNEYQAMFIDEYALYEMMIRVTRKDQERYAKAQAFQDWVFGEVLPSIRVNGGYIDPTRIPDWGIDMSKYKDTDMTPIEIICVELKEYGHRCRKFNFAAQHFRSAYDYLAKCYTNVVSDLFALSRNRDMFVNPANYPDVDNLTSSDMFTEGMRFLTDELEHSENGREIIDKFIDEYGEYPVFHDMYSGVGCGVCSEPDKGIPVGVVVTSRELSKLDIDKMKVDLKADKIIVFGRDSVEWKILNDANAMMMMSKRKESKINDLISTLTRRICQQILDDNEKNVMVAIVLDSPDDKISFWISEVINTYGDNDMLWYPNIIGVLDKDNNVVILKQVLNGIQEWLEYRMGGTK